MNKGILILLCFFSLISCNERKIGNIVIEDLNEDSLFKEVNLYLANFENTNIEANIFLRNKITKKDSIIRKNVVKNEKKFKNHIILKINRFVLIRNDIYVEFEGLTSIILSDVGYSSYCVIYTEEKNNKVDFHIQLRSSPTDIRLKGDSIIGK